LVESAEAMLPLPRNAIFIMVSRLGKLRSQGLSLVAFAL
jgi:hypothetical protein